MNERFTRIELMLGSDACARLREASVTVVGLGAVGSYAIEGLARSGIGKLRLVDFDKVAPSNINRQLYALTSTLGRPKCEVARERVLDINPDCEVEAIHGFVDGDTAIEMIGESPDLVIDAIDALNPKVELISVLRAKGIPTISCLGAALRLDPTMIRIATIDNVHHCPLGRVVRQRLKRRGVTMDFPCIYSDELLPNPLPVAPPPNILTEDRILDRGRARNTLGSMPTITGMFGLAAANLAVKILVESGK
ncbi:MAG: tRNA threonylcarbamoyladenosine dehydratase [Armatimonadota bacterium]|nr:tRNA threonylcarbamoyladenosine dehydratase [bacterium]